MRPMAPIRGRLHVSPYLLLVLSLGVLAAALWPGPLRGQVSPGSGCEVPHFDRLTNLALSNGSRVTYFTAPIIVCSGTTRITADSAVVYEATNYTQLFRNVVFQDLENRLTADRANYFSEEDRLRAWGQVVLNDLAEGSVIRGDTMVLLRAGAGREEDRLTVTGRRPRATLYPTQQPVSEPEASPEERTLPDSLTSQELAPDSLDPAPVRPDSLDPAAIQPEARARTGPPTDPETPDAPEPETPEPVSVPPEERIPWEVDAQRIFLEGSRYFRATGDVMIHRDSVDAVADSVEYDGELGVLFLSREARLNTSDFQLSAREIGLKIPQDEIREIEANHEAFLEGEDLRLLAPTIIMFLAEGELEVMVARRDPVLDSLPEEILIQRPAHEGALALGFPQFPIRPYALAEDFRLWGDSIEVRAPEDILEEVKAMGRARGESLAGDSLNTPETPTLIQRDWLEGDTIIAFFEPLEAEPPGSRASEEAEEVPEVPDEEREELVEAPPDSARYRLDRLVARGAARSLYRMAASDSISGEEEEDKRLAIHYVIGDEITILMSEGEVDRMEVSGATRGIHLEPLKQPGGGGGPAGERAVSPPGPTPPDTATTGLRRPGGHS